jgi:hypothetical protein
LHISFKKNLRWGNKGHTTKIMRNTSKNKVAVEPKLPKATVKKNQSTTKN